MSPADRVRFCCIKLALKQCRVRQQGFTSSMTMTVETFANTIVTLKTSLAGRAKLAMHVPS